MNTAQRSLLLWLADITIQQLGGDIDYAPGEALTDDNMCGNCSITDCTETRAFADPRRCHGRLVDLLVELRDKVREGGGE